LDTHTDEIAAANKETTDFENKMLIPMDDEVATNKLADLDQEAVLGTSNN
jgi:hypothetical protein